jgi:hypothetical protein
VTAVIAWLLVLFGPPGIDRAAHLYHVEQFHRYGWQVWDNYWYAGRYELVNYSIGYYPIAAFTGLDVLVVLGAALGSAAFAGLTRLIGGRFGPHAALTFAVTWPATVIAGQYPFALGTAFAMFALLAFLCRHHLTGLLLAVGSAAVSPLAFLLLTMTLIGMVLGVRRQILHLPRARLALAGLVAVLLAEVVILRLFPIDGAFPFPTLDVTLVLALCVTGAIVARDDQAISFVFGTYGAFALAFYLLPTGVGGNIERLADYCAIPLLLVAYGRRSAPVRAWTVVVLAVTALTQAAPITRNVASALQEKAASPAFWAGAIAYLTAPGHNDPNYRVEAVSTVGHQESLFLAGANIPLTRGWYRQDDFPINAPLYAGALEGGSYIEWLRSLAVRYVVLPRDRLDYSAEREAEILVPGLATAGSTPLALVHRDATVDIYELGDPTPLLTLGYPTSPTPGTADTPAVLRFAPTSLALWLPGPGVYELRVRFTPFWRSSDPGVCVAPGLDSSLSRVVSDHGGPALLKFDVTLARTASQALGSQASACPVPLRPERP